MGEVRCQKIPFLQFLFDVDVVFFFGGVSALMLKESFFLFLFPIGWFVVFGCCCGGSIDVFGELGRTSA